MGLLEIDVKLQIPLTDKVDEEHAILLYRRDRTMVVYEKISVKA